jgi:glycine cleavage system H protein
MQIPNELKFSKDHEWAKRTDDVVRIGITDYAQDALGDVVFVDLPKVGTAVTAGASIGEVESTKSVSEIYSPVSGTITAINETLSSSPEFINADPYGTGWICDITVSGDDEFSSLLNADAYRELTNN